MVNYTNLNKLDDKSKIGWKICVLVTQKSSKISYYDRAKNLKDRFSFLIVDRLGYRMSAIAFSEECDAFYPIIEVGGLFEISGCGIAKQQYPITGISSNWQLNFSGFTEVEPVVNDGTFPIPNIKWTSLKNILNWDENGKHSLNFVALIKGYEPIVVLKDSKTGQPFLKRELSIIDQSRCDRPLKLCLWRNDADKFEPDVDLSVMVLDANVSTRGGGITINTSFNSQVEFKPKNTESIDLRRWDAERSSPFSNLKQKISDEDDKKAKNGNSDDDDDLESKKTKLDSGKVAVINGGKLSNEKHQQHQKSGSVIVSIGDGEETKEDSDNTITNKSSDLE